MAESYVQLPADSTGKKLRTLSNTVGSNLVHQEVVTLGNSDASLVELRLVQVASTTTALGASVTFTSASFDVSSAKFIVGSVYADVDGTLYIEQSPDGTNWDVSSAFSVTGGTGIGFSVEVVAPYARVRYTNGATAQSSFRLYAYTRGL